jgi:hypothetical protein
MRLIIGDQAESLVLRPVIILTLLEALENHA